MNPEPFCPDPSLWRLTLITLRLDRVMLHLEPVRPAVHCPECGTVTRRVHSRYQRTPWDLPWAQWPVQLVVHARKFFCDNLECRRRIFAERFPGVLECHARQTDRLRKALLELAHACSAEMAARVGKLLGYPASPDTLINLQRRERFSFPMTQVLGVDEFSLRRGRTFGTLLVDLERHQPIDVLEGCEAQPLTSWLQAHPWVTTIARDRSDAYALAGRTGAPQALQVADRFHLVKNVGDALKEVLRSHKWDVPESVGESASREVASNPNPSSLALPQLKERQPTPRMQALWEAVQQRKGSGHSQVAIARELGVNRKTVRKYLALGRPPAYGLRPPRPGKVMPYLPYLQQRWNEGCHNARRLYHELLELGYTGSERKVRRAVHPWRQAMPSTTKRSTASRHWLVVRPYDTLSVSEKHDLDRFLDANPALAKGHRLKERFQRLVAKRNIEVLDDWIHEAGGSGLKPFESLAKGFVHDYEAIRLALTTPWSTAQCEGQICRVKLIKRQGYGRAKPDLLRQRILHRSVAA